ncbi:MAG: signal peptidase I [Chloroflexi bacterium]|nr:signal peptidase I [Chloroflexota bacterium]
MRAPVLPRVFARSLRLLSYAGLAISLVVAAFVAAATLPVLFGYHTYVVSGGSMEPSLNRGSVAVARATNSFALEVGDVIARTESEDGPAVLHRIARIIDDDTGRVIYTQGDANRTEDPKPVMLLGSGDKVIYSVPYVGYILTFGRSPPGRILLLGVPLVLLAASSLYERSPLRRRRRQPSESLQPSAETPGALGGLTVVPGRPSFSESLQPSAETPGALGGLTVVPGRPSFQPVTGPARVVLADVPDFLERMLSDFPAAQLASVIAIKNGTADLEVALRGLLPVGEPQDGTGYHILIEEARPGMQRLRFRFVSRAGRQQLGRAA